MPQSDESEISDIYLPEKGYKIISKVFFEPLGIFSKLKKKGELFGNTFCHM